MLTLIAKLTLLLRHEVDCMLSRVGCLQTVAEQGWGCGEWGGL